MMIVMRAGASDEQIAAVIRRIEAEGLTALNLPGGERTAIGIASAIPVEVRETLAAALEVMPGVDHVTHISRPYKLASREFFREDTVFDIGGVTFGTGRIVIMAGPCAVESEAQLRRAAEAVSAAGARGLRGGAFKPRTSPYSFQGLGKQGLELLKSVAAEFGLITITEVMAPDEVELVVEHADILQIGARNMQNYPLLIAAGETGHPILLKRGSSASVDELLLAAEYCLSRGTRKLLLCERGMHPVDRSYTRNTLDLSAVPVLKEVSHLPVIIDPSHATGNARYVPAMAKAAVAAGADGLLIEVHPDPICALCDGPQSLACDDFASLMGDLWAVAKAVGREIA
ncbi:MAG: 3-deoxy-7-phosphoheptulonate synthase [Armatimonadetes bacterium]|nr:3-deoxy-7-phosphoheptulonate synthase [Armatimonadota bacterium]MDI9584228.1 3-deoxy-7-phosphoheptulonate synthase [Acidobacteriota bacterium]